ncbi:MAG: DUF2726 domain-containing protein [Veillonella parvula]|uniref:DUF2726 domain-containing protein n=1 Tax=Veillonella parvula TaxID=29466 RepID=A0A942WP89_VEIPA|nr:DUF2726 domain-containing protein [Veillonella parvula]MBS4893807.1 DUF2726 domain-containing protein [Veillonella parvula]
MTTKKITRIKKYIDSLDDFVYESNNDVGFYIRHAKCGLTDFKTIEYLRKLPQIKCSFCSGRKYNTNLFCQKVKQLVGNEFDVLGEYVNTDVPIAMLHKKCGNIIHITPHSFLRGSRCKYCSHPSYRKTTEQYINEVKNIWGNEYLVIGEYVGVKHPIELIHNLCEREVISNSRTLLKGEHACPCSQATRLGNTDKFKRKVKEVSNGEYIVLGEYIKANIKLKLKHIKCGNIFETTPHKFLTGHTRCSYCNGSKGEKEVSNILKNMGIKFIREYTFNDCKYIKPLPFDFAVINKNNDVVAVIEFHGKQHYKPINFFGGEKEFINRIRNDNIKRKFCNSNNIPFLEIPYYKFQEMKQLIIDFFSEQGCNLI